MDVPSPDVGEAEIAALFVASLGLLMTDAVRLDHVEGFGTIPVRAFARLPS